MANGRITVIRAIPGSTSLGPIVRDFANKSGGLVTAFSDSLLPICKQILGDESPIDVLSFGEVVRNFLVLCGEEVMPIAQTGQKQAAMSYACTQLSEDSPFQSSSRFHGFHEAVGQTLDELRTWGIDADALDQLAGQVGPRLASKLRSLSEIDRSIVEILLQLGRQQHSDQIRMSLESTPELEGDIERLLVIIGSEEHPLRILWLKWIAAAGIDLTLVFDRHATNAPIFAGAQRSIERLEALATDRGEGNRLTRNLFATEEFGGPPIAVSVVSAADPLAEVEWALRGCLEQERPDRAGIYVRDLESYAPLLEAAARRFGVSLRMARRAPLLTNSFARLTLTALQFCASNDVRTLSPVVRSSYMHLTGEAQHGLDTELRRCYGERTGQWTALDTWAVDHPEGNEWLAALLEWRRKAVAGSLRLPEWFVLIKEFNREQKFPWVKLENKGGIMDERDRRALNQMERILANHISVDDVTQATFLSLREVVELCRKLWEQGDVSIPTAEEGVRVTADPNVLGEVDRLQVLGMLEGVFPRRRSEDPILTDIERAEISALRPEYPALADSRTKAQAERDEFYRVCAAPRSAIVFSYPLADDQKDNIPAFYLSEAERAVQRVDKLNFPRPLLAPLANECLSIADRRLRAALDGPRETPLPVEIVTEAARSALRPAPTAAFTPNVLRDALQCPFLYLVRHVLQVRVKRQPARWYSLRKLPQVTQLLTRHDLSEAEHVMRVALDAELDKIYAEVPDWEMRLLRAGGQRLIRDWLHREMRAREEWAKEPGSTKANVSFGSPGIRNMMPGEVKLEGTIAGISRLDQYNVAHLYGSSVDDRKDLTETQKLYLGLHLLAIHEPGREGAVEIESMTGKRTLLVLGRGASRPLSSSVADGLHVVDLANSDDVSNAKKEFYAEVKKALASAILRIVDSSVHAIKGEYCDRCDYGELCRRSRGFGEEDSPFGEDAEPEDG